MQQEKIVGDWYNINLQLIVNDEKATITDNLSDSVNYADVFKLVKQEMDIPSKLMEHICGRICRSIIQRYKLVDEVNITMLKQNPPMGAECNGCGIELNIQR